MEIFGSQASIKVRQRDETAWFLAVVCLLGMGSGAVFMVLSQFGGLHAAIGICGLIFLTGTAGGGFLGFLFSVPRILSRELSPLATTTGPAIAGQVPAEKSTPRERLLSSNTNLERISEWLTTMLVGVGLTQIGFLPQELTIFSDFLAAKANVMAVPGGLPTAGILPAVGPFLLISGIITGFLFFYLYTRIYLSPLFQYVEEMLSDPGAQELGSSGGAGVRIVAQALVDEGQANPSVTFAASTPNLTVNQALSVIASLLYQPGRYEEAITTGNGLMTTPAAKTAQFWFLMTAALGQRYHALLNTTPRGDRAEIVKAKEAVLAAARETVSRDPSFKSRLYALTDPGAQDNDLEDFREDTDFLKIVQ